MAVEIAQPRWAPGHRPGPEAIDLLGYCQYTTSAVGAVVEQIGARLDLVRDGEENELLHQPHGITQGPVLNWLFVVLRVERSHQLFKDRAYAVIVKAGVAGRAVSIYHRLGAQVNVLRVELLD